MPIPCYLAMTSGEFFQAEQLPDKIAWMACHYSCYGTALSNCPAQLPEGSLIILNDRTPPCGHDASLILQQLQQLLEAFHPFGFLLDFQRPDYPENLAVAKAAVTLPCPVAVSELYANELSCPVFLPPPSVNTPLHKYLAPWKGRNIWLEVALQTEVFTVTEEGCTAAPGSDSPLPEPVFEEPDLFCQYHWMLQDAQAVFTLQRSKKEIDTLLHKAEGVNLAVGLYQQLGV